MSLSKNPAYDTFYRELHTSSLTLQQYTSFLVETAAENKIAWYIYTYIIVIGYFEGVHTANQSSVKISMSHKCIHPSVDRRQKKGFIITGRRNDWFFVCVQQIELKTKGWPISNSRLILFLSYIVVRPMHALPYDRTRFCYVVGTVPTGDSRSIDLPVLNLLLNLVWLV